VLHRTREVAFLERCSHRVVLARRHCTTKHQRLGSAADAREQCPDEHLIRSRLAHRYRPDLADPGLAQPECQRLLRRGPHWPPKGRAGGPPPPCRGGYPVEGRCASAGSRATSPSPAPAAIPSAHTLSVFFGYQIGSYMFGNGPNAPILT